jgi:hypothetical protein
MLSAPRSERPDAEAAREQQGQPRKPHRHRKWPHLHRPPVEEPQRLDDRDYAEDDTRHQRVSALHDRTLLFNGTADDPMPNEWRNGGDTMDRRGYRP